jgi:hypothetical protein
MFWKTVTEAAWKKAKGMKISVRRLPSNGAAGVKAIVF